MNFLEAKDEFLKWIIPALLVGIWMRGEKALDLIAIQTNHAIKTEEQISMHRYRLDQQLERIKGLEQKTERHDVALGKIEIKIFGRTLNL